MSGPADEGCTVGDGSACHAIQEERLAVLLAAVLDGGEDEGAGGADLVPFAMHRYGPHLGATGSHRVVV